MTKKQTTIKGRKLKRGSVKSTDMGRVVYYQGDKYVVTQVLDLKRTFTRVYVIQGPTGTHVIDDRSQLTFT